MKKLALALASLMLASCLSTGREFPIDTHWIKKDETQQKDVRMVLGDPYAVGNSGGVPTWTYAYYHYDVLGHSYYKELKIYWNPNNSVQYFSMSSSFPQDLDTMSKEKGEAPSGAKKPAASDYPRY